MSHSSSKQYIVLRLDGTVYHSDNTLFDTQPYTTQQPLHTDFLLLQGLLSLLSRYVALQPLHLHAIHQPHPHLHGYYDLQLYGDPHTLLTYCYLTERTPFYQRLQAQQQVRNAAALGLQ